MVADGPSTPRPARAGDGESRITGGLQPAPTRSGASGSARVLLAGGHDPHAERNQRDGDDLETGDAERDADDRQAEERAGHQVAERQPPPEQDDPDDVAHQGPDSGAAARLDGPAERPEHIVRDTERRDAERDRNDQ